MRRLRALLILAMILDPGEVLPRANALAACIGSSPSLTAPTWDDVAACHTAASNGDTITVTPGTYTATVKTSITKYVRLLGTGVTITNNVSADRVLAVTESTAGSTLVSGFTFNQGTGPNSSDYFFAVGYTSGGAPVLFGNLTVTFTGGGNGFNFFTHRGAVWGSTFSAPTGFANHTNQIIHCYPDSLVTESWTTDSTMGTADTTGANNLYVETNTFNRFTGETVDGSSGCRYVFRYNTMNNSGMSGHGWDTSLIGGVRHYEIYNNTFIFTTDGNCDGSGTYPLDYFIFVRGGTGVIADNVIPDITSCAFGNKGEIKLTVMNLRRSAGTWSCWGNGSDPGEVYPAPEQIGQSFASGASVTDPLYIYGNSGGGNYGSPSITDYTPNECGAGADVSANYLVLNRDYVLSAKPGYAKYPYPHPLTASVKTTIPGATTFPGGLTVR